MTTKGSTMVAQFVHDMARDMHFATGAERDRIAAEIARLFRCDVETAKAWAEDAYENDSWVGTEDDVDDE